MSERVWQITEVGEKMIVDAFEEMVKHGYPPPSHPAGEAEEGLRVLCGYITLGNGIPFSQIVKDTGLNDLERNDLLLSFATIILAFRLHDMKLVNAVSKHLTDVGLGARIDPHLDMSGIDLAAVDREMQETMANLEPEPLTEITTECCTDGQAPDAECCEDDEA